jgi:hypothetical protein
MSVLRIDGGIDRQVIPVASGVSIVALGRRLRGEGQ